MTLDEKMKLLVANMSLKEKADKIANFHAAGIWFGYPVCCVDEFCGSFLKGERMTARSIDNSGFIPCTHHSDQVKEGKIKIEDLIKDRLCPTPFPED